MTMRQPRYGDIFAGHDQGAEMAEMARVLWAEYKSDLEARELWNAVRARIVDRLVRAAVEYHHLHPLALAEGPISKSEKGGEFFSYRWSAVQKLSDQVAKMEKALAITPESIGAKIEAAKRKPPETEADKYLARHPH